ncbi:MAG: isopentenyl phosphate kinase [Candidatus Aenigmatarchaeota archaeon]
MKTGAKPLIILKLGGSSITDKKSATPKANSDVIARLAKEVADAYSTGKFSLVIVHGAGSFGHGIVKEAGIDKGLKSKEQLLAFAEVQRLQNVLNVMVTQALIEAGVPAMPCQASSHAVMENGRISRMDTDAVKGLVEKGMVPVLYGVPAYDMAQGCSILSGDQIAPYIAKKLNALKIIHGTNVDGIYTADPNADRNARQIALITAANLEEVKKALGGSTATDVTGGMAGKVQELADIGIGSQITSALIPGRIKAALLGESVGTVIRI